MRTIVEATELEPVLSRDRPASLIRVLKEGNIHFINAIQIANPALNDLDAARVANEVLIQTSRVIADGGTIAFVKKVSEDKAQLIVLGLEIRESRSG